MLQTNGLDTDWKPVLRELYRFWGMGW